MGILDKFRKWYDLNAVADRLTVSLGDEISVNDVLQLALDNQIELYWYTRNHLGRKIVQVKSEHSKSKYVVEKTVQILKSPCKLELKQSPTLRDFIYSLKNESKQQITQKDRIIVSHGDDRYLLVHHFKYSISNFQGEEDILEISDTILHDSYNPSNNRPNSADLGITLAEIERFEKIAQNSSKVSKKTNKKFGTREKETLLKIIAVMAMDGYRYDPKEARSNFPKELEGFIAEYGEAISAETIKKKLTEACALVSEKQLD